MAQLIDASGVVVFEGAIVDGGSQPGATSLIGPFTVTGTQVAGLYDDVNPVDAPVTGLAVAEVSAIIDGFLVTTVAFDGDETRVRAWVGTPGNSIDLSNLTNVLSDEQIRLDAVSNAASPAIQTSTIKGATANSGSFVSRSIVGGVDGGLPAIVLADCTVYLNFPFGPSEAAPTVGSVDVYLLVAAAL